MVYHFVDILYFVHSVVDIGFLQPLSIFDLYYYEHRCTNVTLNLYLNVFLDMYPVVQLLDPIVIQVKKFLRGPWTVSLDQQVKVLTIRT